MDTSSGHQNLNVENGHESHHDNLNHYKFRLRETTRQDARNVYISDIMIIHYTYRDYSKKCQMRDIHTMIIIFQNR